MSRIACLRIPLFPIAVQRKLEPELKGRPFALIGGRSRVVACSEQATVRAHVRSGMRLSEARAACADLLWRDYDSTICWQAQKELLLDLVSFSPKVSSCQTGTFLLDASGLRLLGGENKWCRDLLRFASRKGFVDGSVGVADSAFAAVVAASDRKRRWLIVPPSCDRKFLSVRPIELLPASVEMRQSLLSLGVKTMGQLTAIPVQEVRERFGPEGVTAFELACGIDNRQPGIPVPEKRFQCVLDCGFPVESLNDALFVIKSLLGRLVLELEKEGLCAEEISASFYNESELIEQRSIRLIRPSNNSKFLLEVLRLSLENKPLPREFTGLRIEVLRLAKESFEQLQVGARRSSPAISGDGEIDSDAFVMLLQRLTARLGEGAMVRPAAEDQHVLSSSGRWVPAGVDGARSRHRVSIDYISERLGSRALSAGIVLKLHKEPIAALVELSGMQPSMVSYEGRWYRVSHITSPERISGLWWDEPVRKSYYMAGLEPLDAPSLLIVLLVYDYNRKQWQIEGVYD